MISECNINIVIGCIIGIKGYCLFKVYMYYKGDFLMYKKFSKSLVIYLLLCYILVDWWGGRKYYWEDNGY